MINQEYKKIHSEDKNFGTRTEIPKLLLDAIEYYNPSSILDFGCGKGLLISQLKNNYPNIDIQGWDPAFNNTPLPKNVDMIISTDVLEHIEYHDIDNVIQQLKNITNKAQYHLIACHRAAKILSDRRNAHLIVEAPDWWKEKFDVYKLKVKQEHIESRISKLKNGNTIAVVKYHCVIE